MRRHLIDALPAITGLAAALTDTALGWAGTLHTDGTTATLILAVAIALGRALSVSLHARIARQEAAHAQ